MFVFACVVVLSIRTISNHLSHTLTGKWEPNSLCIVYELACMYASACDYIHVLYACVCVAAEGAVRPVSAGER